MLNPIPGTNWRNCGGYDADSGLDILVPKGTPCIAAKAGLIIYAEHGHTSWVEPPDTPNSVLIRLDEPVRLLNIVYNFIWYTHLSEIDPSIRGKKNVKIKAGDSVGKTGIGNKVPHLHFGVVVDRGQSITMPWQKIAGLIWGKKPA